MCPFGFCHINCISNQLVACFCLQCIGNAASQITPFQRFWVCLHLTVWKWYWRSTWGAQWVDEYLNMRAQICSYYFLRLYSCSVSNWFVRVCDVQAFSVHFVGICKRFCSSHNEIKLKQLNLTPPILWVLACCHGNACY